MRAFRTGEALKNVKFRFRFRFLILCVAQFLMAGLWLQNATAASLTYSDRSLFESELSTINNIDFENNYPSYWNSFSTPTGLTLGGVNFVGPSSLGYYLFTGESDVNTYGSTFGLNTGDFLLGEGRGSIDISLPASTNAVGLDFVVTEAAIGSLWDVTFGLSSGETFTLQAAIGDLNFFGVISDSLITGVSVKTTLDQRPPQFAIDNVTFGAAPSPVPLPAALPLFLTVLAGMGFLRWWKRRVA